MDGGAIDSIGGQPSFQGAFSRCQAEGFFARALIGSHCAQISPQPPNPCRERKTFHHEGKSIHMDHGKCTKESDGTSIEVGKKKNIKENDIRENKYRGGTSDATTSSPLIVSLIMTSFDDFLP